MLGILSTMSNEQAVVGLCIFFKLCLITKHKLKQMGILRFLSYAVVLFFCHHVAIIMIKVDKLLLLLTVQK